MKQIPYWGSTNIPFHRIKFSRLGDLAPGIYALLMQDFEIFLKRREDNYENAMRSETGTFRVWGISARELQSSVRWEEQAQERKYFK